MRFAYKIHSSYDGFTPKRIPQRMVNNRLHLGWAKYIDEVEVGDEIWVFFRGPHRFVDGVYVKGLAESINLATSEVVLAVTEFSVTTPVVSEAESEAVARVVSKNYLQVFFLPDDIGVVRDCHLLTTADTCEQHRCLSCPQWKKMPVVTRRALNVPERLRGSVDRYVPGYWVIPRRSFIFTGGRIPKITIRRSSDIFYRFKSGDKALTYPLALAMHKALAAAGQLDFDAIVPVPLSPEKAARGELHRTLELSKELGKMLGVPVKEWLTLSKAVSKRHLRGRRGYTAAQFETAYDQALEVDADVSTAHRILIVDDVCTEGSTLRVCAAALTAFATKSTVVAATAGQMIVRGAVRDEAPLLERGTSAA